MKLDHDNIFEDLIQKESETKQTIAWDDICLSKYQEINNCIEELYGKKILMITKTRSGH